MEDREAVHREVTVDQAQVDHLMEAAATADHLTADRARADRHTVAAQVKFFDQPNCSKILIFQTHSRRWLIGWLWRFK